MGLVKITKLANLTLIFWWIVNTLRSSMFKLLNKCLHNIFHLFVDNAGEQNYFTWQTSPNLHHIPFKHVNWVSMDAR